MHDARALANVNSSSTISECEPKSGLTLNWQNGMPQQKETLLDGIPVALETLITDWWRSYCASVLACRCGMVPCARVAGVSTTGRQLSPARPTTAAPAPSHTQAAATSVTASVQA